jgi:hypothetical protein
MDFIFTSGLSYAEDIPVRRENRMLRDGKDSMVVKLRVRFDF